MSRRIPAAFLMALILVVAGCNTRPDRVVVGIALTSPNQPAVRMAAEEINAAGGADGVMLELVGLEWSPGDAFDPSEVLKWAEQFDDSKDLVAVIGHSDSASTLSAAAVYNQRAIPQLVTIATNPAITNIGIWTYRLCLSDAVQGPALAEYAVRDWNKRTIAVFFVNDPYGRDLASLFEKRVRQLGGTIVSSVMHRNLLLNDDKVLIETTLRRLKQAPPDLIALFQRTPAADWTLGKIREGQFQSAILGSDSLGDVSFVQANPDRTEGIRVSQFFLQSAGDQRAIEFARDYAKASGKPADYGPAFAYDAVYLIRDAVLEGGFSRSGVKSYLDRVIRERKVLHGVGGDYTLGENHDARRPFYIVEARAGKHHLMKTIEPQ